MSEPATREGTLNPIGLGGWLILVGVGLVVSPLRLTLVLYRTFLPIFQSGAWEVLTTPGTETYHVFWGPMILFEVIGNLAFVAAGIAMLVLFFSRSSRFPRVYVVVAISSLLFILLDAWFGSFLLEDEPMLDPETLSEIVRAMIGAAIWVPYMLTSMRVRNTFVE